MSAIWGIVSRNNQNPKEKFDKMTEVMKPYKIDRMEELGSEECFVACGHQYFTEEALVDRSPIYDEKKREYFVADCFLYNRAEIFAMLGNQAIHQKSIGDAELAFRLYQEQGLDFVKQLRGSFAFAIYNETTKQLHLLVDHFCKRYLAYHISEDHVAFASCYKPLLEAGNHDFHISKESIICAYSTMTPLNFRKAELTPFEGIVHLDASMCYTIDVKSGSVEKKQYWNPRRDVKKLKKMTDEDYKTLFLNTYRKVCVDHLRARKETGIMLSGGLDSASVLAMVGPALKEQNKKIYSYTTIPCSGYKPRINYSVIEDESFLIRVQQKYHTNLEPRFIDGEEENCIKGLPKYQDLYDLPVKAVVNGNNVFQMGQAAVADQCSILLGGGNGNATVSYGYITNYVGLCIEQFKFVTAVREVNQYCKICGSSRKQMFKSFIKDVWYFAFGTKNVGQYFISKENRKKYKIAHLMRDEKKELGSAFVSTERHKRNFMYIPQQYIQKSLYYTLNSLEQGYLQLDPTLSVEMVELCMSLPNQCFVKDGVERRLIRDYMKDMIPPVITDMRKGYGVQASDFNFRINRDWNLMKDEIMSLLQEPMIYEYLDRTEMEELISDVKKADGNMGWNTAWFTANTCSLAYFLRGHKEYFKKHSA